MKKKLELFDNDVDVRDIDWQAEAGKGNYLVGNDAEGYRYAVHNVVEEIGPAYHDEGEARMGLYEHLISLGEEVDLLPSYQELRNESRHL